MVIIFHRCFIMFNISPWFQQLLKSHFQDFPHRNKNQVLSGCSPYECGGHLGHVTRVIFTNICPYTQGVSFYMTVAYVHILLIHVCKVCFTVNSGETKNKRNLLSFLNER